MRQILTLLISVFLISSCSEVRFSQPQPLDGDEILAFPEQFTGKYIGTSGDTLVVRSEFFYYADDELKRLCSDRVVLKKKDDYYIISTKEMLMAGEQMQRKGWEVLPFELVGDSLFVYFLNTTSDEASTVTLSNLESILDVERVLDADGEIEYYYIAPNKRQFDCILNSHFFSIADKFTRIE